MAATKKLYLYLHTHWDREWYLTHEEYRTQLTFAARDILNKLKRGALPSFMLDGQSCIMEDLDEIDSSFGVDIRQLMAEKRLDAGPWYVLADQMLVSGESLLRNLEMGLAVTSLYGKPAMLGYCPDTFGHSQDLPRILQNFAIPTAFVWRGVPDLSSIGPVFWWTSPDGSKVLTYHIFRGYYQTAFHDSLTAEKLAEFCLAFAAKNTDADSNFNSVLLPVGGDHLSAPGNFKRQLESTSLLLKIESMSKVSAQTCALSEFADLMMQYAQSNPELVKEIDSELRDNFAALQYERAYMLAGVLSTRLYLKQENRNAERRLARISEPIFTLLDSLKVFAYPQIQLNYAWRTLMRNHPHDSMCGCSVDSVHREMLNRFDKVREVLNVLDRKAFEALSLLENNDESGGALGSTADNTENAGNDSIDRLFGALANQTKPSNPPNMFGSADAKGIKNASLFNVGYKLNQAADEDNEPPLKALAVLGTTSLPDPTFGASQILVANLTGESEIGPLPISWCEELAIFESEVAVFNPAKNVVVQVIRSFEENYIFTGTNQIPETKKVRVYNGFIHKKGLPSFGLQSLPWKTKGLCDGRFSTLEVDKDVSDVRLAECRLSNEYLNVTVGEDGSVFAAFKATGSEIDAPVVYKLKHRLRDVGDGGDSYNFDPLEGDSPLLANFVKVEAGLSGPLVASLLITYELAIPVGVSVGVSDFDSAGAKKRCRSSESVMHVFTTEIQLKKSVPILFFETTWINHSRNHRLEVLLDTGEVVRETLSENHFSLVKRVVPLDAGALSVALPVVPGTEAPLDRFPCQRFFVANRQVFFNDGLPEYGVDDSQISITILRAITDLSRPDLRTRGGGAGPSVVTDEANSLGLNKVRYGWAPLFGAEVFNSETQANFPENDAKFTDSQGVNDELVQHSEAEAVLQHLAESAHTSGDVAKVNALSHHQARAFGIDGDIVDAYRLCEIFECLHWSCFTHDLNVNSKSHVAIDNPAVRLISLRVTNDTQFVELRLLNVLLSAQTAQVKVNFAHSQTFLTFADGRPISELVPVSGSLTATDANLEQLTYGIELGANSLVTIRLNKG